MAARVRSSKRSRKPVSYAESELGSYDSQTDDSSVQWSKKKTTKKTKSNRKFTTGARLKSSFVSRLDEKECILFKSISNNRSSLKQIVKQCIKTLGSDEEKFLTEITNFLTQSSGSLKNLSVEQVMTWDRVELEDDITRSFDLSINEYPLAQGKGAQGKIAKKLSLRISSFWKKIIQDLGESDQLETLLDHTMEWLKCLCKSRQAAIRHTCAAQAYWIVDGLIADAITVQHELEGKSKQLDSKKNRKLSGRLSKDVKSLEQRLEGLNDMMKKAFDSVFIHRYRDTKSFIRKLSLESIGEWIQSYPDYFLKNDFLKYLGWCLNDQDASVRFAVLSSVKTLLESEDHVEPMRNFLERFMPRFLEMVEDTDSNVAAAAVETATSFIKYELLEEDQGGSIPALIWDHDEAVSAAAAGFIVADTFSFTTDDEATKNEDDLLELVMLFHDNYSQLEEKGTVSSKIGAMDKMIEGLHGELSFLQDWKLYTKVLLSASGKMKTSKKWEEDKLEILAHILLSVIKCTKNRNEEIDQRRKDKKESDKEITAMSKILSGQLSKLLNTYEAESESCLPLVQIPRFLDLDVYSGRGKNFKQLLKSLKSIYMKHIDANILKEVVRTVQYLSETSHDLAEEAEHFGVELLTLIVQQLSDYKLDSSLDEESLEAIKIGILRLLVLAKHKDCSSLIDLNFDRLMEENLLYAGADMELGKYLLDLEFMRILWEFRRLEDNNGSDGLDQRVGNLYEVVSQVLVSNDCDDAIKTQACKLTASLFVISSSGKVIRPADDLKENFRAFLESKITNIEDEIDSELITGAGSLIFAYSEFKDIVHALLMQYSKNSSLDEVLKAIMSEMRKTDFDTLLKAQLGSLKKVYKDEDEARTKELASKFALLHSFSAKKHSFSIFLKEGVEFSRTEGITFLDTAVLPFAKRCSGQDLKSLYGNLYREKKASNFGEDEGKALDDFMNSLKKILKKRKDRKEMPPPPPITEAKTGEAKKDEKKKKVDSQEDNKMDEDEDEEGEAKSEGNDDDDDGVESEKENKTVDVSSEGELDETQPQKAAGSRRTVRSRKKKDSRKRKSREQEASPAKKRQTKRRSARNRK